MTNEGIQKAAELFREKIELAHNGSNRSQDILQAIREFLKDLGANISNENNIPADAQQEILQGVERIITKNNNNNA